MTRIVVQRGSSSSSGSSSASRSGNTPAVVAPSTELQNPRDSQESIEHVGTQLDTCGLEGISEETRGIEIHEESSSSSLGIVEKVSSNSEETVLKKVDEKEEEKVDRQSGSNVICTTAHQVVHSCPPAPPVPPPKPVTGLSSRRLLCSGSSTGRSGGTRRSFRSSPTASRPSSPRSLGDDGYNSADEQNPCFAYYYDAERERQFEIDLMRSKGLEVRRMVADGNCLFRAVADQVYGDEEMYDDTRQMCIDYMEKERDHFSQFVTESFSAYCKRKRRDKVYGNNLEIQAMSEMYNRPIHIYSYSTDPINIFHGNYSTDSPPIRLSYHRGNHYNSLVDPHHMTVGAGLGFSNLQGKDIDKEKVKATIKAQQDHQIESALLAEGRFYSDLELTQKELERMVMETSKNEYIAKDKCKQQLGVKASSTSTNAEPSSSAARPPSIEYDPIFQNAAIPTSVQTVASMGFDHVKVLEAHSIFGDDVEAMVYYLLETGGNSFCGENIYRMKGKATEK